MKCKCGNELMMSMSVSGDTEFGKPELIDGDVCPTCKYLEFIEENELSYGNCLSCGSFVWIAGKCQLCGNDRSRNLVLWDTIVKDNQ